MNIRSEYDRDMGNHYYGPQLGIRVPMPQDYTPEELKYAQEELVRLTYLSMYKIIDTIGQRREDAELARRQATENTQGQEANRCGCGPQWCGYPSCPSGDGDSSGGSGERSGNGTEAQASAQAPSQEAEAGTYYDPRTGGFRRGFKPLGQEYYGD